MFKNKKRSPTEWGEIFVNDLSNKGTAFRIYNKTVTIQQ